MPTLYRYVKHVDAVRTVTAALPPDPAGQGTLGTELATIDGVTYLSIPDGTSLPAQPPEIVVEPVALTAELTLSLKAASPHVRRINERVREKIAESYSIQDEIKLLRTAPTPEHATYDAYAEECRAWGRAEKAKLGL